jgi:hypothetical protein
MEYEYDSTITILEREEKERERQRESSVGSIPYQLGVPPSKRVAEGNAAAATSYLT